MAYRLQTYATLLGSYESNSEECTNLIRREIDLLLPISWSERLFISLVQRWCHRSALTVIQANRGEIERHIFAHIQNSLTLEPEEEETLSLAIRIYSWIERRRILSIYIGVTSTSAENCGYALFGEQLIVRDIKGIYHLYQQKE
jgi:hypothetical protein